MKMIFSLLMMLLAIQAPMLAKSSSESSGHCKKDSLCPKRFKLPRVNISNTEVQPKGSLVFNCTDKKVYFSDGTNWIALEDEKPAERLLVVDQSICYPDGVTTFNTIQSAIDSLDNKKIVGTTIKIAPGNYDENLVLGGILNSDVTLLQLLGDERGIAGCGINHGSYWNTFNFDATTYLTVGGAPTGTGEAQFIGAQNSSSFTVNGINGCISPDFVAAGVVAGSDKILIRHNDGSYFEYFITGASANVLTLYPALQADANGLGAAMCIEPNVAIMPTVGTAITCQAYARFTGLFVNSANGTGACGIGMDNGSSAILENVLVFGDFICIGGFEDRVSSHFTLTTSSPYRNFGATGFLKSGGLCALRAGTGGACTLFIQQSLFVAGPGDAAVRSAGLSECAIIESRFIGRVIGNLESNIIPASGITDIIVHSGAAMALLGRASLDDGGSIGVRIRGAATGSGPTIGIDLQGGFIQLENAPLSFDSANPAAKALRVGISEPASGAIAFGPVLPGDPGIKMPNATGQVVQVLNGSNLNVVSVAGPINLGAFTSGIQVKNNSALTWSAGGFSPTSSSTGILFDIEGNSSLIIPANLNSSFTNFQTIFNFDAQSYGSINDVTCTTTAGGTNLAVKNKSQVDLGTATFTPPTSGANTGIATSFGGFVGKQGGSTIINNATTPISGTSCSYATNLPMSGNPCTYNSGLIQVAP